MLRNREWNWYLLFTAIVVGLGLAVGFSHPAVWPTVFLAASVLCAAAGIGCTAYRYQKLRELAGYLTRIRTGDVGLDVRNKREGELSILKNEIYKLTRMLTEQAELLKKDKSYLTDALSDISHQLKTTGKRRCGRWKGYPLLWRRGNFLPSPVHPVLENRRCSISWAASSRGYPLGGR